MTGSSTGAVAVGQPYRLKLAGLGAAGYVWEYAVEAGSDVQVDRDFEAVPAEPAAAGWSADVVFTVTPQGPGRHVVRFVLRRPWERQVAPQDEHTLVLDAT